MRITVSAEFAPTRSTIALTLQALSALLAGRRRFRLVARVLGGVRFYTWARDAKQSRHGIVDGRRSRRCLTGHPRPFRLADDSGWWSRTRVGCEGQPARERLCCRSTVRATCFRNLSENATQGARMLQSRALLTCRITDAVNRARGVGRSATGAGCCGHLIAPAVSDHRT